MPPTVLDAYLAGVPAGPNERFRRATGVSLPFPGNGGTKVIVGLVCSLDECSGSHLFEIYVLAPDGSELVRVVETTMTECPPGQWGLAERIEFEAPAPGRYQLQLRIDRQTVATVPVELVR